jgi:hypothetical protein
MIFFKSIHNKIKGHSKMSSLSTQFFYHLIVNNVAPIMASSVTGMTSTYFSGRAAPPLPLPTAPEINDERELELLQMERMLKWMSLIFEDTFVSVDKDTPGYTEEAYKGYKKELYSIYCTIRSDYTQYQQWKQYNNGIWLLSSYRNKDTKSLAKKILADVKLFQECLKMFSMFDTLHH